jgi:hypothetical protein
MNPAKPLILLIRIRHPERALRLLLKSPPAKTTAHHWGVPWVATASHCDRTQKENPHP